MQYKLSNFNDEILLVTILIIFAILSYFDFLIIDKWIIIISLILVVFLGKSFAIKWNAESILHLYNEKNELENKIESLEDRIRDLESKVERTEK